MLIMVIGKDFIVSSPFPPVRVPNNVDIYSYITRNFHNYPARVALIDAETRETITFGQLEDLIDYTAANLYRAGYDRHEPLAIFMRNCLEYPLLALAAWRLGGSVTCINAMLLEEEVRSEVTLTHSTFLICDKDTLDVALKAAKGAHVKKIFCKGGTQQVSHHCFPLSSLTTKCDVTCLPDRLDFVHPGKDTCLILFSSGTTGLPKGVQLPHRAVVNACRLFGGPETDQLSEHHGIVYQPLSHVYGIGLTLSNLYWGVTHIIMPKFELELFLKLISEYKVDQVQLVPPIMVLLASTPLIQKYDISCLKSISCGAAPLSHELEQQVAKVLGPTCQIRQCFGMTETVQCTGHYFYLPNSPNKPAYKCYVGSIGYALPGMKMKVIDIKTGNALGPNKEGELCVKSDTLMLGYLHNREATERTLDSQGWLHTGDIAYYNEDGCFYVVDRVKELIKYKAYQVAPAELEAVLLSHPSVTDAGVVGLKEPSVGEVPFAWVVCKEGSHVTKQDIQAFVNGKVASFKQLRGGIRFVKEIPKSPSGKILRREISKAEAKTVSKL